MSNDPNSNKDGIKLNWAGDSGEFKRQISSIRSWISNKPGSQFPPMANRYHLYVSYACPWATRALIFLALKGLQKAISVSVVHWHLTEKGWHFDNENAPGCTPDHVNGFSHLSQLYFKHSPDYGGRFTVPLLWDKQTNTAVNNESSEIIRMLNSEFNDIAENPSLDLYPQELRAQIDETNQWIYDDFNNGVYKTGFATKQAAYEQNCVKVFESLDRMEGILKTSDFLVGNQLTETDVRAFVTAVRFDPVYLSHFKCNLRPISSYPNIVKWMRKIYQMPGVAQTTNFEHIKKHYYISHVKINPNGIYGLNNGPALD